MMNIQKKYKYKNFVFVLINDFSLIAFSNAIEPLRIANRQAQKEIYTWKLMSENGENVKCSSGWGKKPKDINCHSNDGIKYRRAP